MSRKRGARPNPEEENREDQPIHERPASEAESNVDGPGPIEGEKDRAILIAVLPDRRDEDPLEELRGLCDTAGIEPIAELVQIRRAASPSHYFGKGKTEELAALAAELHVGIVVVDEELAPMQARNLERALDLRVIDRSELILSIFTNHARSKQAILQVELARRQYELPRLRRLWTHLDRERGGIGMRGGMGEKQIEVDRRLLKREIRSLRRKLDEIEARKQREVEGRRREYMVSLVGYTNAGKSTLMNALTGSHVLEEDRLFSTLDTRTKRWELGEGRFVLLSDTVGFIRSIPHGLVASFHATLAEALQSHLLLVIVDVSVQQAEDQLDTVLSVLDEVGAGGKEHLIVLNKTDAMLDGSHLVLIRTRFPNAMAVSAKTGEGLEALGKAVRERLDRYSIESWLRIGHEDSHLQATLRGLATVLEVRYSPDAAYFKVLIPPDALQLLSAKGVSPLEGESEVPRRG